MFLGASVSWKQLSGIKKLLEQKLIKLEQIAFTAYLWSAGNTQSYFRML